MYNLAVGSGGEGGDGLFFETEEDQVEGRISNKRAQHLIYKNEWEKWGAKKDEVETPSIVDVNVNKALGSATEVEAQLLRNLHQRPGAASRPVRGEKRGKDDPGVTAKRKHQITYLAYMAKQREEDLKDEWSTSRFNRNQSRMKYGF